MTDITANVVVSMPSQLFTMARSFKAVANGKIYIGKIDTDPVNPENQIQVYVENEDGSHVPVSQPIIINAAGYPVYNGQIAKFVTVQGHSMAVYDAYGSQQFYFPNILKYDPDQFSLRMENVADIHELMSEPTGNHTLNVIGYVPGTNFGGGQFYWDASKPKSQHNGITIFSPTVPWDGSYAGLAAFLSGTGETDSGGTGCWMRSKKGDIMASWAGFDVTGNQVADDIIKAACILAANTRRCLRIDPGSNVKWGFTHLIQYHDKFNLNLQTSVILDGINGLTVYADNDVEFNTDHPTYRERVVFGVFNGKNNTFKGFNWNSNFTDYSISPTDTEHRIQEHWKGFMFEGCSDNIVMKNNVNACQIFVMADNINLSTNLQNKNIQVIENRLKYVVNYCFLSRALEWYIFDRNEVSFNGRKWHTYGEAAAPTTQTKHIRVCDNKFTDQIAQQSCITPGPHIESGLISGNYCKRHYGIFIENGSSSNLLIENNTSISTGERADTTHILFVGEVDDQPTGNSPHSNVLIQGNMFIGGGFSVQEYNTGIALRYGFSILNNHMVDCKMPAITNQSFIGIRLEGNYMHAPDDFPDLAIAGQYPVIQNNTLIGVIIRARNLGYTILSPKVVNNKFQANSLNEKFPAIIDFTDFSGLVAEGNDTTSANYEDFIVNPINCNIAGFKRIGQTEGFIEKPSTRYGSKLTCQLGDIVMNREPSPTNNKYAWVCMDGGNKIFGDLNVSI
ncbi:phage head-binding domain-containing protein [Salmonella enterica]|nr:phage tail protein [Salmonella enterica]EKS4589823.1 phage tail protein [Salmonella enterica]EKS4834243.1 phage tail protein [Salmonella enterica]EKS6167683.1 phage tail protein [Salmonella enterica]